MKIVNFHRPHDIFLQMISGPIAPLKKSMLQEFKALPWPPLSRAPYLRQD